MFPTSWRGAGRRPPSTTPPDAHAPTSSPITRLLAHCAMTIGNRECKVQVHALTRVCTYSRIISPCTCTKPEPRSVTNHNHRASRFAANWGVIVSDPLLPMTGGPIAATGVTDGSARGRGCARMADHQPVSPSGRGRGRRRSRRNRPLSRERRMAGPHAASGPHSRGHRCRRRHAMVPSQRPAASWRLRPGLRVI